MVSKSKSTCHIMIHIATMFVNVMFSWPLPDIPVPDSDIIVPSIRWFKITRNMVDYRGNQ